MTSPREEIESAERHDAVGEHDAAINALARAAQAGSAEANLRLGKRLIVGDRAPLLPKDGVRLLMDAGNAGNAEAPARLATLMAAGVHLNPSLEGALQLQCLAAQRGWQPAQEQLCALADDADESSSRDWQQLASRIDLGAWIQPPPGQRLSDEPLITAYDDLLPRTVCEWLIAQSRDRLKRALVYDAVGGREIADHSRTNSIAQFGLIDTELLHLLVQIRLAAASGVPLYNMEATAVLHYSPGEEITNHFDFVNPRIPGYEEEIAKNGQRILTFLVYLNDDYHGGETEFPKLGIKHKGALGQGLSFVNALGDGAPDVRTVHAGRPPVGGEKWIVSQFVRNRRVLGA